MLAAREAQPARTAHAINAAMSLFICIYPLPCAGAFLD
jgi:hypothetical protein